MKIPIETFEEHLEDAVLEWAFDHHDKERLKELRVASTQGSTVTWGAQVLDGRGGLKGVRFDVVQGAVTRANCTCNAGRKPICRHAALAIMELAARAAGRGRLPESTADAAASAASVAKPKRQKRASKVWSLASAVGEMGDEALRGLVLMLAEQDAAIAAAITLAQGHTDPKESKEKYSKVIKSALLKASGRAKKLPVAIEKEIGRTFERFLDAADQHFAQDRFVTGSLQLMAICEELARMEERLHPGSPAVAAPWRRAISMTARAAGFDVEEDDRQRIVKAWYKTAGTQVVMASENHVSVRAAGLVLAQTNGERAGAFTDWNLDSLDGHLLIGFLAYLEGHVDGMEEEWSSLLENQIEARRFFPHFYFRGDFDVAEKCALMMTQVKLLQPESMAFYTEQGWLQVLEVAEAKPDPTLLRKAHRNLVIWSQEQRLKHFEAFAQDATRVELQQLGRELARTGVFITVESLRAVMEVLGRTECQAELVDLAFNVLKKGFPVDELIPAAQWLRGPMQNMWTDFISMQAVEMAPYLFSNHRKLVSMAAEMKRAASPNAYQQFRKKMLARAPYPSSMEDILAEAEALVVKEG